MILVTGSLAFDQILDFPGQFSDHILPEKLHMLNISFLVDKMRKGFGGTAGNIAYTLALLGMKTCIMGIVGPDFTPYREFLEKNHIDTSYIQSIDHLYTSTAIGFTDKKDNQIWGFHTGADSISEGLSLKNVKEKIDFGIIAPHNPRTMLKFAKEYQELKIPYLFDPGMQLPWLNGNELKLAFSGAKIIIGNDYEISVMQKKTGISDLHDLSGQDKIIITTLGENGSKVTGPDGVYLIKSAKVKLASDPAGAGDCSRAGFLAGFLRGFSLKTCGQMGSVASAYTVEKYGTSTHKFTRDDFIRRYKDNYHEEIKL